MANRENHGTLQNEATKLAKAMEQKLGDATKITINGSSTTVGKVAAALLASVAMISDVDKQRAQLRQAVQKQRATIVSTKQMMLAIERYLQGMYGPRSEELLEFGVSPLRARGKSAKTKSQAAVKAQATREAREEVGSQKRKEIVAQNGAAHGVVQTAA